MQCTGIKRKRGIEYRLTFKNCGNQQALLKKLKAKRSISLSKIKPPVNQILPSLRGIQCKSCGVNEFRTLEEIESHFSSEQHVTCLKSKSSRINITNLSTQSQIQIDQKLERLQCGQSVDRNDVQSQNCVRYTCLTKDNFHKEKNNIVQLEAKCIGQDLIKCAVCSCRIVKSLEDIEKHFSSPEHKMAKMFNQISEFGREAMKNVSCDICLCKNFKDLKEIESHFSSESHVMAKLNSVKDKDLYMFKKNPKFLRVERERNKRCIETEYVSNNDFLNAEIFAPKEIKGHFNETLLKTFFSAEKSESNPLKLEFNKESIDEHRPTLMVSCMICGVESMRDLQSIDAHFSSDYHIQNKINSSNVTLNTGSSPKNSKLFNFGINDNENHSFSSEISQERPIENTKKIKSGQKNQNEFPDSLRKEISMHICNYPEQSSENNKSVNKIDDVQYVFTKKMSLSSPKFLSRRRNLIWPNKKVYHKVKRTVPLTLWRNNRKKRSLRFPKIRSMINWLRRPPVEVSCTYKKPKKNSLSAFINSCFKYQYIKDKIKVITEEEMFNFVT